MNQDLNYLKLYSSYLKPHWKMLSFGFLVIPLISVVHLVQPFLIKKGIDEHIAAGDLAGLGVTASLFGLCVFLELLFRSSQSYIFQRVGIQSVTALRKDLFSHILGQSSTYYDKTPTGKLVTRVTSDIEALNETFSSGVVTLLADILTLLGILACMFYLSPKLTIITILVVPPLMLMVNYFKKKLRYYYGKIRTSVASLNAYLQEQLEGYQIVQLYQRENKNYQGFNKENNVYKRANMGSIVHDSMLYSMMEGVSSVVIIFMIFYGFSELESGAITLGLLIAFIEYIRKFFQPLKELSSKFAILQAALAALEKIFSAFNEQTRIASGSKKPSMDKFSLRFSDVSFNYPGFEDKQILKSISFEINAGETVAIVGPTGSGKSTVSKLVSHLYTGYQGQIFIGDTEMSELELEALRKHISVVTQDVELFSNTVLFNITLGDENITLEQAKEAARLAQIDQFIESLPQAYQTNLQAKGSKISVGQAQLITLARAIVGNTPFVVLDEATASVDSMSEQKLQTAIKNVLEQKTVLVIAHRLSTIKQADKIIALKDGEIVESGNHEELMAKDGYYAQLFKVQFSHL